MPRTINHAQIFRSTQEGDGKALRHAHERPTRITVTDDLSWWARSPQVGFTALAISHSSRMRSAPENKFVAHRMLQ